MRINFGHYIKSVTVLNPKTPRNQHFCDYRNFENKMFDAPLSEITTRSLLARAAAAEKLQLVLEVGKAAFLSDLFLEMLHRTRDIEHLN